ncbi:MAG: hypothetical protein V4678_01665 [Patescibacteria group bacterium]
MKIPINRGEDGQLLGYILQEGSAWSARTIFAHVIARVVDKDSAEMVVRNEGLLFLQGMWRYYDEADRDWYPCVIKEAFESRVIVVRTNELGFEDPEHYKRVIIRNPTEATLLKA